MVTKQADDAVFAGLAEAARIESEKKHSSESEQPPSLPLTHDGHEVPTNADLVSLRRIADRLPFRAYLIAYVELAERFSYYGASESSRTFGFLADRVFLQVLLSFSQTLSSSRCPLALGQVLVGQMGRVRLGPY